MRVRSLPAACSLLAAALGGSACADRSPLPTAPDAAPRLQQSARGNQVVTEQAVTINIPYFGEGQIQPDPSVCGLPTTVEGSGTLRIVVKTVETGNGKVRVTINSTASGTASGADGSQYTWTYKQQVRQFDVSSLPTPVRVTDQFHLRGKDGAPSYKTIFHLDAELDANGIPSNFVFTKERGNYAQCDPI
jgi:hypothetical protein